MSTAKSKKKLVILAAAALIIAAIIFAVITGSRIQRIQNELDLGMRYLEEFDYISARFAFEGVLAIDDRNADAYLGLAEIEYQFGMPEEALAIMERALTKVSDERLEERRMFYADAIPTPEDIIELENKDLETVLLYTLGKPDGKLYQADLDRVSEIYCAGYMYPQVAITFEDDTYVPSDIGYDADGQLVTDYEAIVEPISIAFDASIAGFAVHCRNASLFIEQLTLDDETMRILPLVRGLQSLSVWGSVDLSLLQNFRHLERLSMLMSDITDFSPLFRTGALPSLTSFSVVDEGIWSEENQGWVLNTIDITGIHAITSLEEISIESVAAVRGLADAAALPNLSSLFLMTEQIDLTQLAAASHLKTLRIDGSGETMLDTSAMSAMTALEYFMFYGCKLSDPAQLAPLISLKKLDLSGLGLSDISFLSGMTQMEYLNLTDNAITDISALSGMSALIRLDMNNNQIADVTPLSEKPQLEHIRMENNRITHLSGITGLTGLKYLLMYGNPVTTIAAVADMPALIDLRVDDAQITDWSPADHVQYINTNNDYWGNSPWR
ncbi:MAG: tetratricopeptide repeat protein [Ruminococcaceae bacterium]|nr:tetratricopeptide repeat protein [Oscillospiraceae bacterium]